MDNIEINIPDTSFKKDFTIIYKGKNKHKECTTESIEEIKTSKEEILRKLRYFKSRATEINQMNEIFIHDSYPVNIFIKFIKTLETHKIEVNEQNINELTSLSHKYEYEELKTELSSFSKNRPDLQSIIDNTKTIELDSTKEEKLSKNLDICLMNQNFINIPLPVLTRILNSPNRVLHNHHLLVDFIKKIIIIYKDYNKDKDNELKEEVQENLQILLSCLDYTEMSNDEIDEFLNNDEMISIFNFRHSKEQMIKFIDEGRKNEKKHSKFETRISILEKQLLEYQQMSLEKEKKTNSAFNETKKMFESQLLEFQQIAESNEKKMKIMFSEMTSKIEQQEKIISKYHQLNEELQKTQQIQSYKIKEFESKLLDYEVLKDRLSQQEKILSKYEKENNEYKNLISKQEAKFKQFEERFQMKVEKPLTNKFAKYVFDYTGTVQSVSLSPGTYKLEVWGSSGGETNEKYQGCLFSSYAGKGGYSSGILKLTKETTLYVYVGECPKSSNGGWNGGGSAISPAAGGGGSTDISLYGVNGSTIWNTTDHIYSRIIVAGGGGGTSTTNYLEWKGGSGGGENGENGGHKRVLGATQTSGNEFGVGESSTSGHCSGGGGGWYGGHAFSYGNWYGQGGSGGSGFVYNSSTAKNYPSGCKLNSSFYLTNSKTITGNLQVPKISGYGTEIGHKGNGYAIITPQ